MSHKCQLVFAQTIFAQQTLLQKIDLYPKTLDSFCTSQWKIPNKKKRLNVWFFSYTPDNWVCNNMSFSSMCRQEQQQMLSWLQCRIQLPAFRYQNLVPKPCLFGLSDHSCHQLFLLGNNSFRYPMPWMEEFFILNLGIVWSLSQMLVWLLSKVNSHVNRMINLVRGDLRRTIIEPSRT